MKEISAGVLKRSRLMYIFEAALEYFVSIFGCGLIPCNAYLRVGFFRQPYRYFVLGDFFGVFVSAVVLGCQTRKG